MKVFSIVILALCGAYSFALADDLLDKTLGETPRSDTTNNVVSISGTSTSIKTDAGTENISALRKEIAALREELGRKDEYRAEEVPAQDPVADYVPRRDRISATGHLLRPIRLQVEGGGGDGSFFGASLSVPWGWFDIAMRSHVSSLDCESKEGVPLYYRHHGRGSVSFLWHGDSYGLVELQLNLWRESFFAPYLGVGGGWRDSNLSLKFSWDDYYDYETADLPAFCFNGGIRLNGEKVMFDFGALMLYQSSPQIHSDLLIAEICGDLGFYLAARTQLHILAKHKVLDFKSDSSYVITDVHKTMSASMFGVGLSYDF